MAKKKTTKKKKPTGRPPAEIDWNEVEKLCAIHCTGEEIAEFVGCSYDTLERRVKKEMNIPFAEYLDQKRGIGKISLRRKQYTTAMKGNVTMLIWLGKNWLNQKDKLETDETKRIDVHYLKDALDKVIDE